MLLKIDDDHDASEKAWVAARLRSARGFRDVSQGDLAAAMGIGWKRVNRWEAGDKYPGSTPSEAELIAIIEILKLRADWFELPMSRAEALEAEDVQALRQTARDMGQRPGKSHSAVLKAVREARKQAKDQA